MVHLTDASEPSFGVSRVGPVFTPREHRGRGYAAAAVALVSARLLEQGVRVCLFTDQANPTSNALYERLGYRRVVDMAEYVVAGDATAEVS
ncbi:GNAT family N-acetyltransferase [Nocardioides sp.]|uniref:GNAT family N-acetyltransferase n=1 Tax=Nocardioides sp. TaxID=35761 RepID=UPI003528B795